MSDIQIRYQEWGGILMAPGRGAPVPAVRVSDGALVIVAYDRDLVDAHEVRYHGRSGDEYSSVPSDRVLCVFPGVELAYWTRAIYPVVVVVVPCPEISLGFVRAVFASFGLRLATVHREELQEGTIGAGVVECLERYLCRRGDTESLAVQRLPLHGAPGLTAGEVAAWVQDVMLPRYHTTEEDTARILSGLVRIGRARLHGADRYEIVPSCVSVLTDAEKQAADRARVARNRGERENVSVVRVGIAEEAE